MNAPQLDTLRLAAKLKEAGVESEQAEGMSTGGFGYSNHRPLDSALGFARSSLGHFPVLRVDGCARVLTGTPSMYGAHVTGGM